MRTCAKCTQEKPLGSFYKRSDRNSYHSWCKSCKHESSKQWNAKNKAKHSELNAAWYEANKGAHLANSQQWYSENRHRKLETTTAREAHCKLATPVWADRELIKELYALAQKLTEQTGVLFGTDTAAANTLDDYERGNWTPVADSGITGWASLESATYVKIGDLVTVNVFVLSVTGKDANQIQLSGLPFASKGGRHFSPGPCEIADLSTSSDSPFVRTNAGADTLKFFKGAREDVAGNDVTGAGNIILTVTYQVA